MSRSVLILFNPGKPEAIAALPELRQIIARAGGRVLREEEALTDGPAVRADGVDLVAVIGGDGTVLTQCRRCAALGLPMLGVNLGKLGFIVEHDLASVRDQAATLFGAAGRAGLPIIDRTLMLVTVRRAGAAPDESFLAMNDCVVTAGPPFRMIGVQLSIDGEPGPWMAGDGVIVSTPIGSTAYNASAGGAILAPGVRALAVTPICAHSLSFRPVIVPDTMPIELVLTRVNDEPEAAAAPGQAGHGTTLVIDGQPATRLHLGDRVAVRAHEKTVSIVRNPRNNYWQTLITKMNWALPPRLRGG